MKGNSGTESQAAGLISDAQLFVARDQARGNADFALMNNGGARTDLMPAADGTVTFGQIFAMQPFANNVVTKSYTGTEIKALLSSSSPAAHNSAVQAEHADPIGQFSLQL